LDRDYKTEHNSEHRAKFCGDRPTDLGDYAMKKNKRQQKISPFRKLSLPGKLNIKTYTNCMGVNMFLAVPFF